VLEQHAVGIIQPDICHAGGMSKLHKIGAMAEIFTVTLAPHNSNGPISTVASPAPGHESAKLPCAGAVPQLDERVR
jgi:L-alanine-DL-glutamate epimerase-like enolase superfamily enzyme